VVSSVKTSYGIRMTVTGFVSLAEMAAGYKELKELVAPLKSFAMLVDKRTAKPYSPETSALVEENMAWLTRNGLGRWVVMFADQITALQTSRLTKKSGLAGTGRYVGGDDPDAERKALDWLLRAIEPDAVQA